MSYYYRLLCRRQPFSSLFRLERFKMNLVCPKCKVACFRNIYGCEHPPCYYKGKQAFDAQAYRRSFEKLVSTSFEQKIYADFDRIFKEKPLDKQ